MDDILVPQTQKRRPITSPPVKYFIALAVTAFAIHAADAMPSSGQTRRRSHPATTQTPRAMPTDGATAESLARAIELLRAGRREEAEPFVQRVVQIEPRNADARTLLGVILDQRGLVREAETQYREAIRLRPKSIAARANLGVLLARMNRNEEAVALFRSVLSDAPGHPQATFNLGVALFNLKRNEEAEAILNTSAALSQYAPEAFYHLGLIAARRGAAEEAAGFWQRALALRENYPEVNFALAEELRRQRRYEGAAEFYERALAQDGSKLVYHVRMGGVLMLLSRYDAALEIFRRASELFPKSAEAHYFVGIAARGRGEFDVAEAALRSSLALKGDNVDALAQLGFVIGERGGRDAEAERILRRAVALDGKHFFASYDLGRLLVRAQRYEEAIAILRGASRLRERDPGTHYQLFIAYSRLKRAEDAERELALFKKLDEERRAKRSEGGEEQIEDTLPSPAPSPPD